MERGPGPQMLWPPHETQSENLSIEPSHPKICEPNKYHRFKPPLGCSVTQQ